MQRFTYTVLARGTGMALADALVTIYLKDTADKATLYAENDTTGETLANPLTTDAYGAIDAFIPDGTYDLRIDHAAQPSRTIEDVQIFDLEEMVADAAATSPLAQATGAANQLTYWAGDNIIATVDFFQVGRDFLEATTTAEQLAVLGLTSPAGSEAARQLIVGQDPGMYATLDDAVTAAAALVPAQDDRVEIVVMPGKYTMTAAVVVPSFVGIRGVSKGLVQFQNDTTDMFQCSDDVWFQDFLIEGSATVGLYAFDCNDASAVHIRDVDMLNNGGAARQRFLKQVGATWSVLFIEHCVIDYRGTSNYACLLHNTSGASRIVDTNINDVFFDAYGLTNYGGSFEVQACRDVRFKRSTIRGAAVYNTGVRLELAGATGTPTCEIRQCDFANLENAAGGVSVYNELGTTVYMSNTDAPGSIFDGGSTIRNSNVA